MQPDPKDEMQNEEDHYEAAEIAEPADEDEDALLNRIEEAENNKSKREILLGKIAVARSKLAEAQEARDTAKVAELKQKIAGLVEERKGL